MRRRSRVVVRETRGSAGRLILIMSPFLQDAHAWIIVRGSIPQGRVQFLPNVGNKMTLTVLVSLSIERRYTRDKFHARSCKITDSFRIRGFIDRKSLCRRPQRMVGTKFIPFDERKFPLPTHARIAAVDLFEHPPRSI